MSSVRIAMAQINPTVGDLKGNVAKIREWVDRARSASVDLVIFPELVLCGYPPEDLLHKRRFLRDTATALERVQQSCRGINVLVGFPHAVGDTVFNAAALIGDGELIGVYHKIELPNYGVFDEKRYFTSGTECLVFDLGPIRCSVTVCEDIWIPGSPTERCVTDYGARIALNISGSPYHAGKLALRKYIVDRFARATNAMVFYNNLVGGQDELVFDGGSFVVDASGNLVAMAPSFEEDLLVTDVPISDADAADSPFIGKPPVPSLQLWGATNRGKLAPVIAPDLDPVEEIYKALVLGTGDYVRKTGFKQVVIGLSGGIDSSLVAAIAVDALGKENVIGVTMPSQYTSEATFSDAAILAESLGIRLLTIPLKEIFASYVKVLEGPLGEGGPGVELENLQARIRGNILMALSNRFGWLVLTTGNKSETAVGYCTLYGDTAGGFAVIKDVLKTLVYELAEYVNRCAGRDVIPRSVIERAPSAELRPDQKDEDSLPPYAMLDPVLKAYVEEDKSAGEIDCCDASTIKEVVRMVDRNEYKRRQAPPGVKITPKAFGRDRRLPITNQYRDGNVEE